MDAAVNEDASRCLSITNEEAGGVVLIVSARFNQVRLAQAAIINPPLCLLVGNIDYRLPISIAAFVQ